MANNEKKNLGEDVVGRSNDEDQDDLPNLGDGHSTDSIQL